MSFASVQFHRIGKITTYTIPSTNVIYFPPFPQPTPVFTFPLLRGTYTITVNFVISAATSTLTPGTQYLYWKFPMIVSSNASSYPPNQSTQKTIQSILDTQVAFTDVMTVHYTFLDDNGSVTIQATPWTFYNQNVGISVAAGKISNVDAFVNAGYNMSGTITITQVC